MFGGFIKKTIYLPSGGAEYPPFAYVGKPDAAYVFMRLDHNGSDSSFDVESSTIRHYCDLPAPMERMFTQDLHYIWTYMMTTDMVKEDTIRVGVCCPSCGKVNTAFVAVPSLDISIVNRFEERLEISRKFASSHGLELEYGIRRAAANIEFGYLMSQAEDASRGIKAPMHDVMAMFIATQTERIADRGAEVECSSWLDAIRSMTFRDMATLFEDMREHNKSFGIYDRFTYSCKQCGRRGASWLYDDISMSIVSPTTFAGQRSRLEDTIKGIIEESRLPAFTMEDVLSRPMRFGESFANALREVKFHYGIVVS